MGWAGMRLFKRRRWKLTARVTTEDGGFEQTYTSDDGLSSPEFARGFVCGAAWAKGVTPDMVRIELI